MLVCLADTQKPCVLVCSCIHPAGRGGSVYRVVSTCRVWAQHTRPTRAYARIQTVSMRRAGAASAGAEHPAGAAASHAAAAQHEGGDMREGLGHDRASQSSPAGPARVVQYNSEACIAPASVFAFCDAETMRATGVTQLVR